jgi:hypothetical protein
MFLVVKTKIRKKKAREPRIEVINQQRMFQEIEKRMSEYEKCVLETTQSLKKKGIENYEAMAGNMCKLWADDNGIERNFARDKVNGDKIRSFAVGVGELSIVEDFVEFPVTAITSGLHDADGDQKVYIEPSVITNSVGNFKELPIYYTHQRTPEDLIGKAINPEVIETDDGKTAIKMLAKIDKNANERARQVLDKVDDGDITHVSIDWSSNDVDVMGEPFATDIRPAEISFIDNEIATPVCESCTIDGPCEDHEGTEEKPCCDSCTDGKKCECDDSKEDTNMTEETVNKSDAETIVEREFASVKNELADMRVSYEEVNSKYTDALATIANFEKDVEERAVAEAKARKGAFISKIVAKELVLKSLDDETKKAREEELSAWEETKLDGFASAMEAIPEAEASERTFGKGKAHDEEDKPVKAEETTRLFAMNDSGRITLNKEALRGN